MAHFAQLDENNVVTQVIVVANQELLDANGVEQESIGIAFCENLLGGKWKQTSYNGNFCKRYACIGGVYDGNLDIFINPKPFNSWIFNEEKLDWVAPIPKPEDGQIYLWNEETTSWVLDEVPIGNVD